MKSPEYFFLAETRWNNWATTKVNDFAHIIVVGTHVGPSFFCARTQVDAKYPGFFDACLTLSGLGCDETCVTEVLKFCILRADGLDLNKFLIEAQLLSKIEIGIAIGSSTQDLVMSLEANPPAISNEPPNDMTDVPSP